jgi:hypothetical protein
VLEVKTSDARSETADLDDYVLVRCLSCEDGTHHRMMLTSSFREIVPSPDVPCSRLRKLEDVPRVSHEDAKKWFVAWLDDRRRARLGAT